MPVSPPYPALIPVVRFGESPRRLFLVSGATRRRGGVSEPVSSPYPALIPSVRIGESPNRLGDRTSRGRRWAVVRPRGATDPRASQPARFA